MDLYSLSVFRVAEQGLVVLPTVQCTDLAKGNFRNNLQTLGLSFSPDGALDGGRLDLAPVTKHLTIWTDVGLDRVEELALDRWTPKLFG